MNEMVERVAKALYEKIHNGPIKTPWATVKQLGGEHVWCDLARAAIEAMREPTVAMMNGGQVDLPDGFLGHGAARKVWQAMADEALR